MSKSSDKVGSLNYTPYKDLTEEHLKKIKTIADAKGKRFIETISEDGKTKIRREIDGLTQQEIQGYMGSLMTSEELTQMKINGWAKFGQDENQARELYSNYNNQRLEATTENIKIYEAREKNTNLSPEQRKEATQKIEALKETEKNIKRTLEGIDSVPVDTIGLELEKGNYLNGLSQLASTEWSQSIEANDVYYKDKTLELAYEKNEREKLEFEAKMAKEYGLGAAGQPLTNGVVTISPAEVNIEELENQVGQENLQKRHDTYYKTITNTAKSILQSSDIEQTDKDAFEAELRLRNLDKNLKWIDPSKVTNQSVATTVKAAFDAAKLGGVYKEEAEILSNALIKKQNIAKNIVSVESEAYSKTFNANPDKYIDFLNVAESQLSISGNVPSVSQIFTGGAVMSDNQIKATGLSFEIKQFVKKAGGWKNVKAYLEKNPDKIREFAELTDKADNTYKGFSSYTYNDRNLVEDSKVETERLLQQGSKSGAITSFTDYNTINFINKAVNQQIISSIPQDRINGKGFDADKPITAKLVGDSIEITQHQGSSTSKWNYGSKQQTTTVLDKGDASYDIMMKYINAKEEEQMGFSADDTTVKFTPSKPNVPKSTEKVKSDNIAYNILQATKSNPNIAPLFASVGGNPTAYTNDAMISNAFEVKLAAYPKEQVEAFTQEYLQRLPNFSLTPFVSKLYGDKKWAISIKNDENEEILNASLGVKTLDKDTQWMMENAPQTFITEFILRELLTDKKQTKINTILNGGN
jgi:hypothetical protein